MDGAAANILFVTPSLDVGGTGIQLALLSRGLLPTEFKPHVLCLTHEGELAENVRRSGVPVDCAGAKKILSFGSWRSVSAYCREWNIDLAHLFLSGRDLAAAHGARVAGTLGVVTTRRRIAEENRGSRPIFQRLANKKSDIVLCNCEAVRDHTISQEGLSEVKTSVIHGGFPEDHIPDHPLILDVSPQRSLLRGYMIEEDEWVLACLANFSPVKNHYGLLDALRKVLLEGVRIRLILIGDGPLRESVERYAEEQSLGMATVFLGRRLDRLKILAECHAVVLPSLSEGFPNAVLEAQALGVPVVAGKVGGIPEMIDHGNTGWMFDPEDVNSMAGAIWTVLTQREDAVRCALNAQQQVRKRFTDRDMIRRHVELYRKVLKAAKA